MRIFKLRGIAEGVMGVSEITAASFEALLLENPVLSAVKDKLVLDGDVVKGFAPCDG